MLKVHLEGDKLGKVIRDSVSELADYITDNIQSIASNSIPRAYQAGLSRLDEMIYSKPHTKYKYNYNLRDALTVEVEKTSDGAEIYLYNDTDKVRGNVNRPKQQPIEEIPITIETGEGYPEGWKGTMAPRPYMETAAKDTLDDVFKQISDSLS
jgi:hypothetical protein